ncbi:MAG: flagellar biosynthetic protein FliO [Nannocystaceae bacterium]|nr:flagellar biosynthetic protein FliO [bacterium]
MIDWKSLVVCGALAAAVVPNVAQAAEPEAADARSSAPLVTVTTEDSVEIRVQGVTPDGEDVEWKWGKLVVPIEDKPAAAFAESYSDETVKRVALVGGELPRLIVMFRHGSKTAKKLTDNATITNTGDGFRVTIPRKHALTKAAEPEPEEVVVEAEPKAAPVVEAEPEPPVEAEPEPTPAVAGAVEPAPQSEGEPLNLPDPGAEPTATMAASNPSMYGTIGFTLILLAVGGGFMYWKRRTGTTPGAPRGFTVMGNQVLGPKSRIVLMGLGDRRMLLAVSESGTTVVDKWSEGEGHVPSTSVRAAGGLDEQSLAAIEFGGPIEAPQPRQATQRSQTLAAYQPPAPDADLEFENAESTAVRGLLALRQRMEEVEEDADEDDAWSKALEARMRSA